LPHDLTQNSPSLRPVARLPRVVGVVNVSPDSFSGDGRGEGQAVSRGLSLIAEGADILDIGGESSRPSASPVDVRQEIGRIEPVVAALKARADIPLSIDTMKPAVARRAVAAGATIWNDVSALRFAGDSVDTAAELGCDVVLMHMQGEPATMQIAPSYSDVVQEVVDFLMARVEAASAAGVPRGKIWLDPGIGFGKSPAHNLQLLRALPKFVALGFPVMLGASRKGFIRAIDRAAKEPTDRLGGSLATALAGARAGIAAVRVHDVRETRQALIVDAAIREGRLG
jgi:dihydropteroate synthase